MILIINVINTIRCKYAFARADTDGCWKKCACVGFVYNVNDDGKMMIQPSLMGESEGMGDQNAIGQPTSVTAVVFLRFV